MIYGTALKWLVHGYRTAEGFAFCCCGNDYSSPAHSCDFTKSVHGCDQGIAAFIADAAVNAADSQPFGLAGG